jgi:hypothetical protein
MSRNVKVILVVSAYSLQRPGEPPKFLLVESDNERLLPTTEVEEDETVEEAAGRLLKSMIGVQAKINGSGWISLTQAPIVDRRGWIGIPFSCIVPESVVPSPGFKADWAPITDIVARPLGLDHQQIIFKVCCKQ